MPLFTRLKVIKAYKDLFATENGKIVLADLIKEGFIFRNTFNGNKDSMLFNEGKRNIVLYITSIINTDLKQLLETIEKSQGEKPNEY